MAINLKTLMKGLMKTLNKELIMHSKSDNIKNMINDGDEVIE